LFVTSFGYGKAAITYEFSGGRFGDNLLSYLHAKWMSFHTGIPLLYKPFKYSSELVLDDSELSYEIEHSKYVRTYDLSDSYPEPSDKIPWLFVCPYFPEIPWELNRQHYFTFAVEWRDPNFRKLAKSLIGPKENLQLITPPKGAISVAMHIRDGGSFDDYEHHFKHPLKTPPVSYYIESILQVLKIVGNHPVYCHIFTDALNPKELVDQIENSVPAGALVEFNYRRQDNHDSTNVLEDFFSFFNFDVLIRAESNYSIIPSLIHDYSILCSPESYHIDGSVVVIENIRVEINESLLHEQLDKF
jgi:hypothetical protein